MSVLVAITGRDNTKLITKLQERLPNTLIEQWPDCENVNDVDFVLAWKAPESMWAQLPNLKAVSSFGAGVDSIDLTLLAQNVEVVRIVDMQLAEDMAEYVLTHVLAQKLRLKEYYIKQTQQTWKPKRAYSNKHVGILGFGELGRACAQKLVTNGFKVSAWAQSNKSTTNVDIFYGEEGLNYMLPEVDYLVCLLPLTQATTGIINHSMLAKLPSHAVVINVARGPHVVEQDLLNALNNDRLRAATLDVFDQEPLPQNHPYWENPKITLTPHCAALSDLNSVIDQIVDNIECLKEGLALNNSINRTKGY
ncbi:glyoxylate/hydroxypyruvate reductase A [Pseudoalteromonas sp. SWXJ133]|uniref:2-hydroxyacid dehydrogenase n=1 Tax=unclassified Pseudoalteromonas TaxID=194690 RepID=UPI00140D5A8B|nr:MULTISPECIES: glyoxylate/hydroxypyruvate reductase A [unclassified Pseudoalteromonas]MBH0021988.1 glyoxylate/hydroxypyruvate reductase A [Pseudoalteromonas sp. SWXJ133]